jgi:hypothetical protein
MKPLNQAERRTAFASFLLFFLITIGVVVIAVFSSMQVPFKDNKKLKKEKAENDKEMNILIEFDRKMEHTTRLLDSFHLSTNRFQAEAEINKNLEDLAALANTNASGTVHTTTSKMVYNLTNLYNAKKDLRDQSDKTAALLEKDKQIAALEATIDRHEERIISLMSSR